MATPYNRYQVSAYDIDPATGLPKGGIPSLGTSKDVGYTDEEHQKIAAELNPSGATPTGATPTDTLDTSGETAHERAQREYYENLNRDKPDEEKIRQDIYSRMKAQVDVIEGEYADIFREEEEQAQQRLAEGRAIQSRSGLLGSDFGVAQTEGIRSKNLSIRRATEREKSLKIAEVYSKIDQAVKDEVKAKKAEALGNQKAYIDYLAGKDTKVKETVKTLAKGKISLDEFKESSPERYKKLLETFGNQMELDAYYEDSKDKAEQIDYQENFIPNADGTTHVIRWGFDPITNQPVQKEYDLDIPYSSVANKETKVIDGKIYEKIDGKWTAVGGERTTTQTERSQYLQKEAIKLARPALEESRKGGEYVDGNEYLRLRSDYAEAIGNVKDFDAAFSALLSPSDRAKYGIGKAAGVEAIPESESSIPDFDGDGQPG
ncbi:MAG: hypothetical protein [Podoviridae sp. ctviO18]|nr:MAG: hypothetical protein [Podoviridae sp. ctviO18]